MKKQKGSGSQIIQEQIKMFLFKAIVLALLVDWCQGSDEDALYLNHPPFFTYQPMHRVSGHSAFDMDQEEIVYELNKHDDAGFKAAQRVYEMGAHVGPYAYLTPYDIPTNIQVKAHSSLSDVGMLEVTGYSMLGEEIKGYMLPSNFDDVFRMAYHTHDVLGNGHADCRVGGSYNPFLHGCLAETGNITVSDQVLYYTYDPLLDNRNQLNFAKLCEERVEMLARCSNCASLEINLFHDYYGDTHYANNFIEAAFTANKTDLDAGNEDFSNLNFEGRAEAIKTLTVHMSLWMSVIQQLEHALYACPLSSCDPSPVESDYCEPVHSWDIAVAYYTGSLEIESAGSGNLLYSFAQELCHKFKTCGRNSNHEHGSAYVNEKIFELFTEGQQHLLNGECVDARQKKNQIVKLMQVPLIQELLRVAHQIDVGNDSRDHAVAAGAAITASIIPIIANCNETDADTIQSHMRIGASRTSFKKIKEALENNYICLGITCEQVGGLLNMGGEYQRNADPCITADLEAAAAAAEAAGEAAVEEKEDHNNNNNAEQNKGEHNEEKDAIGNSIALHSHQNENGVSVQHGHQSSLHDENNNHATKEHDSNGIGNLLPWVSTGDDTHEEEKVVNQLRTKEGYGGGGAVGDGHVSSGSVVAGLMAGLLAVILGAALLIKRKQHLEQEDLYRHSPAVPPESLFRHDNFGSTL